MACFSIKTIRMAGISACVPLKTESNFNYDRVSESEKELLIKTTGIENRRIAEPGVTASDLCYQAADKLIKELGWNRNEIGLLVFISQSPDHFLPCTAIILQDKLKLPKTCLAFDSTLGCSGFTYGLGIVASLMKTAGIKKSLLLTGDVATSSLSKNDKSTYPLFGDAGCAAALEIAENNEWYCNMFSDGSGYEAIIIPDGGLRHPINDKTYEMVEVEKGITRNRRHLWLKGLDIFSFSVKEVPLSVTELLAHYQLSVNDIDFFLMHQANLLMNETIRKKLKIDPSKVPYSLKKFGNTSSASIPLTMVTELKETLSKPDSKKLLLSGFGAGLSWSNVILNTENMVIPDLIEI